MNEQPELLGYVERLIKINQDLNDRCTRKKQKIKELKSQNTPKETPKETLKKYL